MGKAIVKQVGNPPPATIDPNGSGTAPATGTTQGEQTNTSTTQNGTTDQK